MPNELEVLAEHLDSRVSGIQHVDALRHVIHSHRNRLHKLVLAGPPAPVSTNRVIVLRNVKEQRCIFNGPVEDSHVNTVPPWLMGPEIDLVRAVLHVHDANGQVEIALRVRTNGLDFGPDGIAAGFPGVSVVVDGVQRADALDAGHGVFVDVGGAEAGEGGACADFSELFQGALDGLQGVVVGELAGEEGVFAGVAQRGRRVQLLGEALDALRYVADLHLVLEPLALLLHLGEIRDFYSLKCGGNAPESSRCFGS